MLVFGALWLSRKGTCTHLHTNTSAYSCLYSDVDKYSETFLYRWDMSVPEREYTKPPPDGSARTLELLLQNSAFAQPKKILGSKHTPILCIDPNKIVLDELHLLLRIGDVLLRNVILQVSNLDHCFHMKEGRQVDHHLRTLETLIRRCGVSFMITPVCKYHRNT